MLTGEFEADSVLWAVENRIEGVEIEISREAVEKVFDGAAEKKDWKTIEGIKEHVEWEIWEGKIRTNVEPMIVTISLTVFGKEKVVKSMIDNGFAAEEIYSCCETALAPSVIVDLIIREMGWDGIDWNSKVFLTEGELLKHSIKYNEVKEWWKDIAKDMFTDNKIDGEYEKMVEWSEKGIFKGKFNNDERILSGTQTEWNVLDEVNTTQAIDLAVAVVMVSLKFGRRTYISSQGSVLGVNEVKERLARHGRKMSKGRTKSLMVKTFADFGEVHEAGVVVGGKEGVLVKFMGALLAAGFDEEEAKGVLKGDSGWIDVDREAGEGEEIALRILREEVLDVKDYYEFENQEEKIDVIVKFQRVWNVINGRKEALIREIKRASKLGAAKMCRACVNGEVDFEQDVMVEIAKKSLGVRVVTTAMAEMLLDDK
ncbi:hypothetical protein TrVE_jg10875 [Triparma verrucosa]|uniref:Uncharacterized protein n=2 Tax=Triparma TaxID=722752 RepID=A0A9W7DX64_9STRA|nr:hypothetical protein TrST_g9627 [Triparma strigata]GMH92660.1 hypothetical protein TrVE_jg10875 [Triparma verrucosa]